MPFTEHFLHIHTWFLCLTFFSHQYHMHFFSFSDWDEQQINKMRKSEHTVFLKANLLILTLTFLSKISPTRQNPQDTDSEQGKMTLCMHFKNFVVSIKRAARLTILMVFSTLHALILLCLPNYISCSLKYFFAYNAISI